MKLGIRRLALLAGAALAAASVSLAASAMGVPVASTVMYADGVGDAGGAPDIVAVTVASDASGIVQLSVTTAGAAAIDPARRADVNVFVDTDENPATGSLSGCEYWLRATADDWTLYGWSATDWWRKTPPPSTMSFARGTDTLSWRVQGADLGVTSGFAFTGSAAIYDGGGHVVGLDFAPDHGTWTYDVPPSAVQPVVVGPRVASATAGKRVRLQVLITRRDTGEPLSDAQVTWWPTVEGRTLAHVDTFAGATATSSIAVPKRLKGKLLRVEVTVTAGTASVTKVATIRIR